MQSLVLWLVLVALPPEGELQVPWMAPPQFQLVTESLLATDPALYIKIHARGAIYSTTPGGLGVMIGPDVMLTAGHIVFEAGALGVEVAGKQACCSVHKNRSGALHDLALCVVEGVPAKKFSTLDWQIGVSKGSTVELHLRAGTVRSVNVVDTVAGYFGFDSCTTATDSGAPLYYQAVSGTNIKSYVVGVNSEKATLCSPNGSRAHATALDANQAWISDWIDGKIDTTNGTGLDCSKANRPRRVCVRDDPSNPPDCSP